MDRAFAKLVREETSARGVALILDEVITFRMAVGGMQEQYGIEGDIVCLGKLIGGGMPVGALGEQLRAGLTARGYEVSGGGSLCKLHANDLKSLWRRLYEQGVLIAADGLTCVSTAMDEATVERALEAFERAAG